MEFNLTQFKRDSRLQLRNAVELESYSMRRRATTRTCISEQNPRHAQTRATNIWNLMLQIKQQPPRWHAWWHNHQLFPQTMMKNRPDRCRFNSQRKRKIQRKRQKSRKEGGVQQLQGTRKARRKAQCSANWTIPSICKKRMKRKTREDEGQASDTRLVSGKRGI